MGPPCIIEMSWTVAQTSGKIMTGEGGDDDAAMPRPSVGGDGCKPSLLLSLTLGDEQMRLSFSHLSTLAGSTTLTVEGRPEGLKSLKTDGGSAATCGSTASIELRFPTAQGRSPVGSCTV